MPKKGEGTLKEPPTWIEAIVSPKLFDARYQAKINQRQATQEELLKANQTQLRHGALHVHSQESLFRLKQTASKHQATITEDRFQPGQELKWIQAVLAIDAKDPDPLHDNRNEILSELSRTDPAQVKVPKAVGEDTKDQLAEKSREVNGKFSEYVIDNLQASGKALIVELKNPQGQTAPLALAILKGENGIWLHDPKFGCSFLFKKDDFDGIKKFLDEHIKENHQGFDSGYIVKVFNKESLEAAKKLDARAESLTTAKKLDQQEKRATQKTETSLEQKDKDKNKHKHKPTPS